MGQNLIHEGFFMVEIVLYVIIVLLGISNMFFFIHFKKQQLAFQSAKKNTSLFEELFNALPLPLFFQNKNGLTISNKAFNHAFGSFKKATFETLSALQKNSEQYLELSFDNGIQKSVMVQSINLLDDKKNVLGFVGFIFDMSMINKNKELILTQKQRLELALEGSEEGVWDWDLENDSLFYSPQWKSIMGYEIHEKPTAIAAWLNIVHPRDMAMVNETLKTHIDGEESSFYMEHRIRNSEPLKWVNVRGKVVFGKNSKALRMLGTIRDISQRKKREEHDRIYKDRLVAFLDYLPALAFIKDTQGKYIYMNSSFQKYIDFKTWYNKNSSELFDTETSEKISESDRFALYEGIIEHEIELPNEDGSSRLFHVYKFPIDTQEGEKLLCGFGINKSFSQ